MIESSTGASSGSTKEDSAWQIMRLLLRLLLGPLALGVLLSGFPPYLSSRSEARSSFSRPAYLRYVPPRGLSPAPVLLALHGVGDAGESFSAHLVDRAKSEGWVLLAPTFSYGDWQNPNQLAREGPTLMDQLRQMLERLPQDAGIPVQSRVLLYGFSRGAQLAHRFAMVYPELVLGVAALSAGVYTLPLDSIEVEGQTVVLVYPYGAADLAARFGRPLDLEQLRRVHFLIGVGELDNDPAGLPRQWDPYIGRTRLERARAFARVLHSLEIPYTLVVFPEKGHECVGEPSMLATDVLKALLEQKQL